MTSNDKEEEHREEKKMGENKSYLRLRAGDMELEIQGSQDVVDKHAALFYTMLRNGQQAVQTSLPASVDGDFSVTVEVPQQDNTDENTFESTDLVSFYLQKSPKTQRDEILMITYFYQKFRGHQSLTLKDYEDAYTILKQAAVKKPGNMKSSVRNVVDRTKYLFNPDTGAFALTVQGFKFVEDGFDSAQE